MNCLLFFSVMLSFSLADDLFVKEFSTGYDQFTADIYKKLKSSSGNLIVSPLSVDVVFALINSGARGQTAKEITAALHLPDNQTTIEDIFRMLSSKLQSNGDYDLSSANKVYVKNGFQISDQFKSVAVNAFNAEIENIDFTESATAAAEINSWVENKTHDKIKDIVDPSTLSEVTRTLLVNAIYFHGKWVNEFDEKQTSKGEFYLNNQNKSVETDLMSFFGSTDGYEDDNAQYLKLDYVGGEVSMHIVLPKDTEGLIAIEKNVSDYLVPPKYKPKAVFGKIPKFKIESEISFVPILQELGVNEVFGSHANLRGIGVNEEDLTVSQIVQKAFIEVNEKGTTAAAATYGVIDIRSGEDSPEFMFFTADHPFLFYLRLNKLGINFFVGRYASP